MDPGILDGGGAGHSNHMPQPSVDGNYQILKISVSKIGGARLLCPPPPPLDPPLLAGQAAASAGCRYCILVYSLTCGQGQMLYPL